MKKIISLIVLMLCVVVFVDSQAKSAQSLDQIAVVVNDDVITRSELKHAMEMAKMQMGQQGAALPPQHVLEQQVRDQLINTRLQLQAARQMGIQIPEDELNKIVERVAAQNNVSVNELYQHINQDGLSTADYLQEMREQLTLQKLQQQELAGKMTVTPQEIDSFLHSKTWQNKAKEYHLEDILVPLSDTPSSEEVVSAKNQAQLILTELKQGKTFQEIVQPNAAGQTAVQGGDLGWRKLAEIPSAFTDPVIKMQNQGKKISGPIQTSNGFHVLHLLAIRTQDTASTAPSRKQAEQFLLQQKFTEAVQNWLSKLRATAFIQVI